MEGGRERPACPACGHIVFGKFSVGCGAVLWHEGRVVLIQRGREPGKGRWTFPGGFVEEDEAPDLGLVREVAEETGLRVSVVGLLTIRHAQSGMDHNAYYVFSVRLEGPIEDFKPEGDGDEIARAVLARPDELDALGDLGMITRWVIDRYAPGESAMRIVPPADQPIPVPSHRWTAIYTR